MLTGLLVVCAGILTILSALSIYQCVLAIAAVLARSTREAPEPARTRFVVMVPAHDEEAGIAATIASLRAVAYPRSRVSIVVVADRCEDGTAARARAAGAECLERDTGTPGKGPAIAWALEKLRGRGERFDALVLLDADTVVDPSFLHAFDRGLASGHDVQQGYNYLSNPWDSPFTRIISVTSVLRNGLFYAGKERLGLPAMLSGCGMCFSRRIVDRFGWTAFSVGEDWEFSATLLLNGETIHFNADARVMARESSGFQQASTQRLRWASGRHAVARTSAAALLKAGFERRRIDLCDAALTIGAPTYSTQATLALICLAGGALLSRDPAWHALAIWAGGVVALLGAYFAAGLALTEAPLRALAGIFLIPVFLPWRMTIEILGLLGFGRKRWVRTARVSAFLVAAVLARASDLHAQVIFQDDFESGTVTPGGIIGGWDGPHDPSTMYVADRMAHSGRRALELHYVPGTPGASFMYTLFRGRDDVYVRWYERWSAGFIWEPSATKMVILRPLGGYPQFYPEVLWGEGKFAIQAQVTREANWDSEDFYQNIGEPIVFESERWYCVEVHVKLNTPGAADGRLEAWIDGRLKLQYDGRAFRGALPTDPAPSFAQIEAVGATGYYGGLTLVPQEQYAWQDDFVVSTEPIGFQFLSDDFENDSTDDNGGISGWDGPARPDSMYLSGQSPHGGTRSLELAYAPGSIGAGYMYRHFQPQDQIYLRWYQRWSPDFVWEPSGTAMTGIVASGGGLRFYPFAFGADGTFAVQAQTVAERSWDSENFLVNLGDPVRLVPDRWYCIEVFVKLNAPGASDGQVGAWIDGEKKLFYDGRQFRGASALDPSPPGSGLDSTIAAGSYGGLTTVPWLQFSWHDDYVASTGRVGCGAYPPLTLPSIVR